MSEEIDALVLIQVGVDNKGAIFVNTEVSDETPEAAKTLASLAYHLNGGSLEQKCLDAIKNAPMSPSFIAKLWLEYLALLEVDYNRPVIMPSEVFCIRDKFEQFKNNQQ